VRVGVLASGTGTILEALLATDLPVAVVVADRRCRALDIAAAHGVPPVLVDRAAHGGYGAGFDRTGYTEAVVATLRSHRVDLVAMAGFGTVLAQPVHDAYPHRLLNTHPALLPDFPGWHAVADALAAGVGVTGCTVHLAGLAVDSGPVVAREEVAVLPGDDEASLHERIKTVERRLYPATVRAVLEVLEDGADPVVLELPAGVTGVGRAAASGVDDGRPQRLAQVVEEEAARR
jgi:phosphoribosylglycinamide formyltransferase 1